MMMKKNLFLLATCTLFAFQSCDDDDSIPGFVSVDTRTVFEELYPGAKDVEWEQKGNYMVVEFKEGRVEKEAWFDNQGNWFLTETDIAYDQLPTAVRTAFENGEYSTWHVDDVDWIERAGMEDLYVLDVESGERDADLHYSKDGILVKVIGDNADGSNTGSNPGGSGDLIPTPPASSIEEFIQKKYPGARIIEIDREDFGYTDVDIIYNKMLLELLFDKEGVWVRTTQDVRVSELPRVVSDAVLAKYPGYRIDDAEWVETPEGKWYEIELEDNRDREILLQVTADGGTITELPHGY